MIFSSETAIEIGFWVVAKFSKENIEKFNEFLNNFGDFYLFYFCVSGLTYEIYHNVLFIDCICLTNTMFTNLLIHNENIEENFVLL